MKRSYKVLCGHSCCPAGAVATPSQTPSASVNVTSLPSVKATTPPPGEWACVVQMWNAQRHVQGWASLWNLNAKSSSSVEVMQRSSSFLAGWGTIRDSNWFKYLYSDTVNFFSAPFSQLVGAIISMLIALIILVNLTNLSYNRISQHHAIQWKPKSGNWHKRSCHVSRGWLASTGGNVISHWSIAWHQRDGEGTGCFRRWRSGTQVPSRWEIGNPVLC